MAKLPNPITVFNEGYEQEVMVIGKVLLASQVNVHRNEYKKDVNKISFVRVRLQPLCPIDGRFGPRGQDEIPLRALQFKRGLLHEFRKGNATKEQIRLHNLVQQLPKAIIIGVRKGGTRALLEMLNLHPAVVKASQEIHFFDNDENYAKGIEWYRKKMPFSYPHQITIEKSPAYFITEEVPERIYKMNSSIKLLIIVREPTTRAISDYTQVLEGKERKNKTYYKFEKLAIDPNTCEVNTKYKAVRTSIYTKHLERWLKYFPIEQFHIVDGDRLITEPLPELQLVEKFLNLPPRINHKDLGDYARREKEGELFTVPVVCKLRQGEKTIDREEK
ncbi:hypothetical protein IHE44_0009464 [Lamprotornis superbus]|uniref:Sulfotransferase n=1 Tax=Lamprotornis superbus TaxID=245042 RepID=A0A835U2T6_9PASS|nr:hypothetical protein IHE44_0009464 [Lamprotornis superbus]